MEYKQISEILNTSIVPAIMGEDYTVNPDLSNIIDLGTAIEAMTADQFKDYFGKFVAGVWTRFDNRDYSPEELPLFVDSQEYGGVLQSIKSDFVETRDSHIYDLVDGTSYDDVNKYFGTATNNKVYEKDKGFRLTKSIPNTMYQKSFKTASDVAGLVALINGWIEKSIARDASALEHNLMAGVAQHGKQIDLVTRWNALVAAGAVDFEKTTGTIGENAATWSSTEMVTVTSTNCIYNKAFMRWALETIRNIVSVSKFANKKYNDGTCSTWVSRADSTIIFNSLFNSRLKTLDIDMTDIKANIYDTPFWNAQTDNLVPTLENSAHVIYTDDGEESGNKSINNVIALYFDRWACGYTITPIAPRVSYNADGDFYNTFYDFNRRWWIDTRNTAVVFTLN